jgi:heme-degrading monooxygenase HmoA
MYSASFMWEPGTYDADFQRLNKIIDDVARSLPGFIGIESWQNVDGSRRNAVYYWDSLGTLKTFSSHPVHLEAKKQYAKWYKGYHIVVAEILRSYGDDRIAHITPNSRSSKT